MNAPRRRGACPGLSSPMPTGDGLLVRLMPAAPLRLDAFSGLCAAATQHGNGIIEVSARGSLQVRGLTPASAPRFAAAVADLAIAADDGVQIITNPLDDDPDQLIDMADVVAALRAALTASRLLLSPKVSVIVDGGGLLHLDALAADVRLRAISPAGQPRFAVGLAGDAATTTWLGSVTPEQVVDVVLRLLGRVASHGASARTADIVSAVGADAIRTELGSGLESSPPPPPRPPAKMIGCYPLRDSRVAVGVAPAFGHAGADELVELARIATAHGVAAIRPAPARALLLIGAVAANVPSLTAAAERLGFIVRADDPRRRIAACPGAPSCASGMIASRSLAAALAPLMADARPGVTIHISGCQKGCAHPGAASLTVVGSERGCGIVHHGPARATPAYHVDAAGLAAEVARVARRSHEVIDG